MYDEQILEFIRNNPKSVSNINYNPQTDPTAQTYYSVAAQNNPEFAQALGDIHNISSGSIAKFNALSDALQGSIRRKYADQKDKENKDFALQRDRQRRKWDIDDRNRAERLRILAMPETNRIGIGTDTRNFASPEAIKRVQEHNKLAEEKDNAQDLEQYLIKTKELNNLRKDYEMNPEQKLTPVRKTIENVRGEPGFFKSLAYSLFGNKDDLAIHQKSADMSKNILNTRTRPVSFGNRVLEGMGFDPLNQTKMLKFMEKSNRRLLPWNNGSSFAYNIKRLFQSNPVLSRTFRDIDDLVLIGNETSGNPDYVVYNKITGKTYMVRTDSYSGEVIKVDEFDLGELDENSL